MSIEQEPAVMNSLNLGVAAKTGDNPYMAMSQKVTSEELIKAATGDAADITELQDRIEKVDKKVSEVEGRVEEVKTATDNKVDWSEYPSDPGRRAIVLANHDSLTGTMVSGEGANLLMLSKWDVTDLGSTKVHTNLNTKDVVTINDRDVVVTDNNISTVVTPGNNIEITVGEASNHKTITVNSTALSKETADQKYLNKTESENFATKESLSNLETEVNNKVDSTYVDQKIADLVGGAPETLDTLKELSDALAEGNDAVVALTQQIGNVDAKVDAITLDSLGGAEKEHTHTLANITDYQEPDLSDVVRYKEFEYNEPNRKTIQLDNYDSISGLTTGGVGANLVMLSKWDVVDFGSTQVHMNLNTLDHVSINDDKVIATTDQIPDVSNFVTSDGLNSAVATKADLKHNHTLSQITDYVAPDLSDLATKTEVDEKVKSVTVDSIGAANAEHTHTLAEITDYQEPDLTTFVEITEFDRTKQDIDNLKQEDISQDGVNISILNRLAALESQVDSLKKTNISVVDDISEGVSQPDQDLVISSQEPVVKTTTVVGKSVDFRNLNVDSSNMKITAEGGDVILNNINTTGELKKSTANTVFAINTNDYVRITQGDINQKSYNCIEIGLNNTEPKNIIIDGIDFNSDLSNNAILVFAHADNAVLTISNCHVKKCSNFLRLSNRTNHKLTVNIVNCQIDAWDTNPKWAGFLCLQDYTSANNEAALEAKLFASDKITINLTNVTGPNGKITTPEDMGLAFGSQNLEKQLGYVIYQPAP